LVVTFAGGVIGLLLTDLICRGVSSVGGDLSDQIGRPVVSAGVAAATAALLGLIGLIAGYFPARTASRLDPVVAMKM
jgi:ABC-type antimicrobial peptide transport system permease subunit